MKELGRRRGQDLYRRGTGRGKRLVSTLVLGLASAVVFVPAHFVGHAGAADQVVHIQHFPTGTPCGYEDSWHAPRGTDSNGNPLYHEGVDFIAKAGVPIYAATDGTITKMNSSNRGGTQLYLTRSDGTYFFHAHISSYAPGLKVGDKVTAGTVIAYIGQTGDAKASVPHLHFEVHPGGGPPVNPYPIVREVDGCYGKPKPQPPVAGTTATTAATATTAPSKPGATNPPGNGGTTPVGPNGDATGTANTPGETTGNFGGLTAMTPARFADTRNRFWLHRMVPGEVQPLTIAGRNGVPADATMAAVNVTVTRASASGHITAWPCGLPKPETSTLNFTAGETVANAAMIGLGKGKLCLSSKVATDLVVDVTGSQSASATLRFTPSEPKRLADTRTTHRLSGGEMVTVPIADATAKAVSINVTSVDAAGAGYLTVWPCGQDRPTASSLNTAGGDVVPNSMTVMVGASRSICIYTQSSTDVLVDLAGTWQDATGLMTAPVLPDRLLDTRLDRRVVAAGEEFQISVAGVDAAPKDLAAAQVNLTATGTATDGFITVWPCGSSRPTVSNLNPTKGQTVANGAIVGLSNGDLCVYSSTTTDLIIDLTAVFR